MISFSGDLCESGLDKEDEADCEEVEPQIEVHLRGQDMHH